MCSVQHVTGGVSRSPFLIERKQKYGGSAIAGSSIELALNDDDGDDGGGGGGGFGGDDDDDDDDCRFVKRITQDATTALRVPVRCEEVSFQR